MTDRIEKRVVLRAPRARVWQAISDSHEFGLWFGVRFDGPFRAGTKLTGRIVPTTVNSEVAAQQKPYEGTTFEIAVESVEPMRRLAFRWHPYAVDAGVDYSQEPTTLVAFTLADAADGTEVTITESGFDRIPLDRRAEAFKSNEGGWTMQCTLLAQYLTAHSAA